MGYFYFYFFMNQEFIKQQLHNTTLHDNIIETRKITT